MQLRFTVQGFTVQGYLSLVEPWTRNTRPEAQHSLYIIKPMPHRVHFALLRKTIQICGKLTTFEPWSPTAPPKAGKPLNLERLQIVIIHPDLTFYRIWSILYQHKIIFIILFKLATAGSPATLLRFLAVQTANINHLKFFWFYSRID